LGLRKKYGGRRRSALGEIVESRRGADKKSDGVCSPFQEKKGGGGEMEMVREGASFIERRRGNRSFLEKLRTKGIEDEIGLREQKQKKESSEGVHLLSRGSPHATE